VLARLTRGAAKARAQPPGPGAHPFTHLVRDFGASTVRDYWHGACISTLQSPLEPPMRHAVLAAVLAFRTPVTVAAASPLPIAARRIGRVVMAWLDHRRKRIDGE
jgi:hypothetical protein